MKQAAACLVHVAVVKDPSLFFRIVIVVIVRGRDGDNVSILFLNLSHKKLVRQEKRRHINNFAFYFNFKPAGL